MSSTDSTSVPLGNRFAVITNDDHTGILWIVSILCLIYTIMTFLLRLEARRSNLGLDDVLASIGTVLASIQYVLIFLASGRGFGKSYSTISVSDAEAIGKYILASQALLLLALGFAKCSVFSLCRRLFSSHMKSHRIVCDIAMGLCVVWSITSVLTVTIDCDPVQLLGYNTNFCHNQVIRWTAVGIVDVLTEVAVVAMAFDGLWPLQMKFSRKLQALSTFVLRLLITIFAALHLTALQRATVSPNRGVALTMPAVYLQVELLYSLISASVPPLNRWLRNFDTSIGSNWLQSQTRSFTNTNNHTNHTNSKFDDRKESQAIPLECVEQDRADISSSNNKRASRTSRLSKSLPNRSSAGMKSNSTDFVPQGGSKYSVSTEAYAGSRGGSSPHDRDASGSMNSDDMIIRKDVHWDVAYEQASLHRDEN